MFGRSRALERENANLRMQVTTMEAQARYDLQHDTLGNATLRRENLGLTLENARLRRVLDVADRDDLAADLESENTNLQAKVGRLESRLELADRLLTVQRGARG